MITLLPLVLICINQTAPDIARLRLPQRIYSVRPVGPHDSHCVVVRAFEPIADKFKKPSTTFFLVDALTRKVAPLPGADALAEQSTGSTIDMLMSPREVWRVPVANPLTKTALRTKSDIQSVCLQGDSSDGYYVSRRTKKSASKLIRLVAGRRDREIHLSSGTPLKVLYALPGRCLVQFDDGTNGESSQLSHLAWISSATGKQIGVATKVEADPADSNVLFGGLYLEPVLPAIAHDSIGGPKMQVYRVRDLASPRVVAKERVAYPDGQNAEMSTSCSGASSAFLLCVETLEVKSSVGMDGVTRSNPRFLRRYFRAYVGLGTTVELFEDSVPDFSGTHGNEWSTACALTNDGRYLVATGRNDGEIQIIPIKP